MAVNKVNTNIYILEYIGDDNNRDRLIFDENQKSMLKSFVKQFKKDGYITLFVNDGNKIKTVTKNIKYLSILKVVETYMKQEEEQDATV